MLQGIRVVELGVWVAGPAAAGILADWGADVIKVEPPAGDPMRAIFETTIASEVPHNPPFELDNRGKRSVVLDLGSEAGRRAMEALLAGADVLVTNMRPAALERLGLEFQGVMQRHPHLVVAGITGYGSEGPERDRAGYDVGAFWARSGVADLFRVPGEPPLALRGGFGDHVTAIATVAGICGALVERGRTGRGRLVQTSLLGTGMYCIGWDLGIQLAFDKLRPTIARDATDNPMVNSYRAADGAWFWLIGVEGDRHFPLLCEAIARPDLRDDPRFASPGSRRRHRRELVAELDAVFAGANRDAWASAFDRGGVWWVPVQSPAEAVRDPQALANGMVCRVDGGPERGDFPSVATPVAFRDGPDRVPAQRLAAVPALGAHTAEVLGELGLGPEEVAAALESARRGR